MAQKRMFSISIINSDDFIDMPISSRLLYYELGMRADVKGFVQPRRIIRMLGLAEDDLKVLITKKFVIPFDSGVVVITHWKLNNNLREDREASSIFIKELSQLSNTDGIYDLLPDYSRSTPAQISVDKGRVVASPPSKKQKSDKFAFKDLERFKENKQIIIERIRNLGYIEVEEYFNQVVGYCETSKKAKDYLDLEKVVINWLNRADKKREKPIFVK